MTTTPNMGLILPSPSVTEGPEWASLLNAALEAIDSHDHSTGSGALVPVAGLLINNDFDLNSYGINSASIIRLTSTGSTPVTALDLRCIYSKNGELAYIDADGNEVLITDNGSVAGATGTISGLVSPASGSLDGISNVFTISWDSGKPAKTATSDIKLYEYDNASANPITIKSPASVGSAFSTTWFSALPASNRMLSVDASGNLLTSALTGTANQITVTNNANTTVLSIPSTLIVPTRVATGTGSAALPSFTFSADDTMGMYRSSANVLSFAVAATLRLSLTSAGLFGLDGTNAAPSYSFLSDTDTGMFRSGANSLEFSTGGGSRLAINTTSITAGLPILAADGSLSSPGLAFSADSGTGMYRSASKLAFTRAGTEVFSTNTTTFTVNGALTAETLQTGTGGTFKVTRYSGTITSGNLSGTLSPGGTIYSISGWVRNSGSGDYATLEHADTTASNQYIVIEDSSADATTFRLANISAATGTYQVVVIHA